MACAPGSDQSFGPRVNIECRPFDFTLLFEDVVFSCIPAALLLVSAPIYITLLLRRPKRLLIRLCSLAYQAVRLRFTRRSSCFQTDLYRTYGACLVLRL